MHLMLGRQGRGAERSRWIPDRTSRPRTTPESSRYLTNRGSREDMPTGTAHHNIPGRTST